MSRTTSKYHHDDLRTTLLEKAEELLSERGINGLTLRELAERAGVSRQAPYHHFASKQALLCALAERAFEDLDQLLDEGQHSNFTSVEDRFKRFVVDYVRYAATYPEKYELMFGAVTWRNNPSTTLVEKGHNSFRRYTQIVRNLQKHGDLPAHVDALRLSQTTWATLHGLCRLKTDGVFVSLDSVEEISLYATNMIFSVLKSPIEFV